ncbi:MAG: arsenite methyltransferase [Myxococcota bacterium]
MNDKQVHETVSGQYAEALQRSREKGSTGCGPAAECSGAAALAGYGEEREAYAEAAASSFGCGNPLAFAGVEPGQTVVDLGSGAGLDLLIAAEKVGPEGRVIGVDMTDAMIEAARNAAQRAGHANVEVRRGLIEELPVEAASVDWVVSNCVINLSPRKEDVFREIHRVLKPAGRISISDIVVEALPEEIRRSVAAYTSCIAGAISERAYVEGLEKAGLTDVQVAARLVYEASQLIGIVEAEAVDPGVDSGALSRAAEAVSGKVWSARFTAAKPA